MDLNDEEKLEILYDFFSEDDLLAINKINNDGRLKKETKIKRKYKYLTSILPYQYLIEEMKERIDLDASEICKLVNSYSQNPLEIDVQVSLKLFAFDSVCCFNYDPIENTKVHDILYSTRGIYVFIMNNDYSVPEDFDEAIKGAPLRKNIKSFKKGEILYIGKTDSFLTRMHQHFEKDNELNKTGAIKLGSAHRKGLKEKVLIYAFQINKNYRKLYEMIGSTTERRLHDYFENYILGNK